MWWVGYAMVEEQVLHDRLISIVPPNCFHREKVNGQWRNVKRTREDKIIN